MSLNPRVCKKSYKVHIPMMGEACEFWLITVTDEQSITNPDKDHAYLTDDGKLFVFNGDSLVRVNCDICFTQEERDKLEGIEENANNYTLPEADSNKLGGVILGYTQNGKNYPVVKDSDGKIYVQVPWVDYALPKAEDDQLGGIKTGYKQNGKYYPVKVDTDGNAYVNIPWSDTNTVYEVVSNTSDGLAPMLPSENPDKKYLNGNGEWVENDAKSIEINGVNVTGSFYSGETSDCGVQITRVVGKTSQKTTNGYQLFDASKLPTKTIGGATLTNNGDGSFTISGSGNLSANFNYYYYMGGNPLKVGRLTLKLNGPDSIVPLMQVIGLNKLGDGSNQNRVWDIVNNNSIDITQELLEQTKDIYIVFYGNQGKEIKPGTIKPMLYQDGDGTWEQYTGGQPAPNPDYAMPIENVEITEITSHGKNILPNYAKNKVMNGVTYKVNPDKSIKITGTANGTSYIELVGNIDYYQTEIFRVDDDYIISGINSNDLILAARKTNGNYINLYINGVPEYDIKGESLACIYIQVPNGKTVDVTVYPQIELGSVATDYQPYNVNVIETSLTLAQDDIYQNGAITRARKQVTFDGSSDETWTASSNPNTFYTMLSDKSIAETNEIKSNRFVQIKKATPVSNLENGQLKEDGNNPKIVYFKVNGVNDLSSFKTWLSTHNLVVEYELATPTTEEFKIPTIPSYYPFTNVSTDNDLTTDITFRPLSYTSCENDNYQEVFFENYESILLNASTPNDSITVNADVRGNNLFVISISVSGKMVDQFIYGFYKMEKTIIYVSSTGSISYIQLSIVPKTNSSISEIGFEIINIDEIDSDEFDISCYSLQGINTEE